MSDEKRLTHGGAAVSDLAGNPRLVYEKPGGVTVEFPLTAEVVTIGRDAEADVVIDEPLVSRIHARIERRGDQFVIIDLGSTNLTRVNGDVILERPLAPGDVLRFARAYCRFERG
jgi:pSer/pThr/pTyr-binding forkhead associated (FHA) protein